MNRDITISLDQLLHLLNHQKAKAIERLLGSASYYNLESTEGHSKSLPIDKGKFEEIGLSAKYPDDVLVLLKYLKDGNNGKP